MMVGSNYPPGMSKRDFVRAGIDQPHHHEHEWFPDEEGPYLEDKAAVFIERCRYAEGEYGQGWSCEEERTYRFEEVHLRRLRDEKPPVTYTDIDRAMQLARLEAGLIGVYQEGEIIDIDPDPDVGHLVVEHDGWQVRFEA
jgi:hypothetical protein